MSKKYFLLTTLAVIGIALAAYFGGFVDLHSLFSPEGIATIIAPAPAVAALPEKIQAELTRIRDEAVRPVHALSERLQDLEQKVCAREAWDRSAAGSGPVDLNLRSLIENESFQRVASKATDKTDRIDLGFSLKAALINDPGSPDSSNGTMPGNPNRIPGYHGFALRPLRLLDLLPAQPQTTNTFEYVRLNATGEAAVQDGEGAEKAEMDFEGALVQDKVQTIAVHTTASAQVLDDESELVSTINRVMSHSVLAKIEQQLTVGSGVGSSIEGIYTASPAITTYFNEVPDRLGEAITEMEVDGYQVNVILMNPKDWLSIAILKDSEGRYLYGNPADPAPPSLWNRPVVTLPSIPLGTALVGDTTKVQIRDRMQPTIFISRDHKDYRTRNLVLILIEARLGLAILDQLTFRRVDLSAAT
ncbi:MAG: phage major capsid protein [Xanthomonadales bacterium]|nr:phage major capsid protein [Xanthomonadales bacterium]